MPVTKKQKSIKKNLNKSTFWVFIALFAIIGAVWLYRSFASVAPPDSPAVAIVRAGSNTPMGYYIVTKSGQIFAKEGAPGLGRALNQYDKNGNPSLQDPIVSASAKPYSKGVYLLSEGCKVYSYASDPDAVTRPEFAGQPSIPAGDKCAAIVTTVTNPEAISEPNKPTQQPYTVNGYWIITKQGRFYSYGHAKNLPFSEQKNLSDGYLKRGVDVVAASRSGEGNGLLVLYKDGVVKAIGDMVRWSAANKQNSIKTPDPIFERATGIAINRREGYVITGYGGRILTGPEINLTYDVNGNVVEASSNPIAGSNPNRGATQNTNPNANIVGVAYAGANFDAYYQLAEDGRTFGFGTGLGTSQAPKIGGLVDGSGKGIAPTYQCPNKVYKATASQCPKPSTSSTSSGNTKTGSTPASSTGGANQGNSASSAAASQLTTEVINNCYTQTLRVGSKGDCVQVLLIALRFRLPGNNKLAKFYDLDDYKNKNFSNQTKGFVTAFQSNAKITSDGIVGPVTWGKLKNPTAPSRTAPTTDPKCNNSIALYNAVYGRYNVQLWKANDRKITAAQETLKDANDQLYQARVAGIQTYGPIAGDQSGRAYACIGAQYPRINQAISNANRKITQAGLTIEFSN